MHASIFPSRIRLYKNLNHRQVRQSICQSETKMKLTIGLSHIAVNSLQIRIIYENKPKRLVLVMLTAPRRSRRFKALLIHKDELGERSPHLSDTLISIPIRHNTITV